MDERDLSDALVFFLPSVAGDFFLVEGIISNTVTKTIF